MMKSQKSIPKALSKLFKALSRVGTNADTTQPVKQPTRDRQQPYLFKLLHPRPRTKPITSPKASLEHRKADACAVESTAIQNAFILSIHFALPDGAPGNI